MPRPGGKKIEKSKDFKGSMIKLIKSLKKWHFAIIISLLLAFGSAIISLIAPNKLANLADYISEGVKPNIDNLTKVSTEIYKNSINNFYTIYSTKENLSKEQSEVLKALSTKDQKDDVEAFSNLDEDTINTIITDITVNEVLITKSDQIQFLSTLKNMNQEEANIEMLSKIDEFPNSIKKLVVPKIKTNMVIKITTLLVVLYAISAIFGYIEQIIMALVTNRYAKKVRKDINKKIDKLPLKYFDNHETGDILSRVTNDVDTMSQNLNQSLSSLITSITLFIGSIIMMISINTTMAFSGIGASLLGFIIMFFILSKSQKYFIQRQEQLGDLNGYIEEIYSGHNIVVSYNGEEETNKEFDRLNNKLFKSSRNSQFLSGIMQPLMGFVGNLGYVAICVVGAILVMKGHIGIGVIIEFMIYVRMFTRPLSQIAQSMTSLQSTAAAAERVFEFLEEEEMNKENVIKHLDKSKVKGKIEFKDVKFGYNENKSIIKHFSAVAKPGQKIAIVGPTGAGKTTMVNLLMKFYEIKDGDILIDSVSTKDLSRENIRELFCMVLQDTWLFDGTVRDNIKYNKTEVNDEEIWEACNILGIDHFIKTLPGGLNAKVGDNESISSGQKQLITIARGMIKDAPFLILDEATSNVDTRTEELVQIAMDKLTEGRTSFIIAHRLSTIRNADLILVMNEGNIIEQGTHDELMKKNGFYANLYNSQFEL